MGEAGNNGASGIWNENKGLYKTSDGNIEILKPEADSDGSTSTAASKGTMLIGLGWFIRRRLGLDASDILDRKLGLK